MYEFSCAFQITRKIIFCVEFHTVGSNDHPYFSTSVGEFNQPKTDWLVCGQCQGTLLQGHYAKSFWEKWDYMHCKNIENEKQFEELIEDLDKLKEKYNFVEHIEQDHVRDVSFSEQRALSMKDMHK